jgi:ATP-binding protein involved in chromosome partitioning
MGIPFLGRLGLLAELRQASDEGMPPASGEGPQAQAFADLAAKLLDALETVRS